MRSSADRYSHSFNYFGFSGCWCGRFIATFACASDKEKGTCLAGSPDGIHFHELNEGKAITGTKMLITE